MEGNLGPPPPPPDRSVPCGVKGFGRDGGEDEQPLGRVGGRGGAATAMVEPMSTEWTDEKHSLYLNSMEASFVNQLYSSNYFLPWTSGTQKDPNSLGSHLENLCSGQFKVLRGGCWGEVKFQRPWRRTDVQKETRVLSRNPWIQHFRSTANDRINPSSAEDMEGDHIYSQATDVGRQRNGVPVCEEATSSSQLPSHCTHLCHQDSIDSNSEVSDQNFVAESEGVKHMSRVCKKRPRTTVSDARDQVVPLGKIPMMSSTDENFTPPRGKDEECSSTKTAKFG